MKARLLGAVALGLLVAACGTDPRERTTGGAAAGAATGAGVGALGGPVGALAGAGIGAAAGAATGAATTPDQVNLGRPLWNDPEVRVPGRDSATGSSRGSMASSSGGRGSGETRQLQQALRNAGYDPGPIDGVYGERTRQAVMDWQRANNMEATGRADRQMMSALGVSSTGTRGTTRSGASTAQSERDRAYMGGGMVVDQQGNRTTGTTGTPGGSMGSTGSGVAPGGAMGGGQGLSRPDSSSLGGSTTRSDGTMRAPSNNPMNDPIGGSSGGTPPGLNNNRDGGGSGGSGAGGGSGR